MTALTFYPTKTTTPPSDYIEASETVTEESNFTPEQLANFGRFVRWARKNAGLTQEQLAGLMDVNISYIRMLESGRRLGTTRTYYKLGKILNQRPGKFIDVLVGDAPVPDAAENQDEEESEIEEAMNVLTRVLKERKNKRAENTKKEQSSMSNRLAAQSKLALDITRNKSKSVDKHVDH